MCYTTNVGVECKMKIQEHLQNGSPEVKERCYGYTSEKEKLILESNSYLFLNLLFDQRGGIILHSLKILPNNRWNYRIKKNVNSRFSIVTMNRVAIVVFDLGVVNYLLQIF